MIPNYFVLIWDGQPVGVDSASGGYPFKTDNPHSIRYWRTRKEAEDYWDMFIRYPSELNMYHNYSAKEIQFRIVG